MGVEPGEEFISDDELKSLLERWNAPGPSRVLDERIETSFKREFLGADRLPESVLLPHGREEVVSMKFCSKCEEQFADKFSFCPVDGNPLSTVTEQVDEPSLTVSRQDATPAVDTITAFPAKAESDPTVRESTSRTARPAVRAAAAASSALALREEYHLTIMSDEGLVSRLTHEIRDVAHEYELTWPEFKRDPFGFTKRTFIGYGQMLRKFLSNRNVVLAMGAAVLGMFALVGAVALIDRSQSTQSSRVGLVVFALIAAGLLVALFSTWLGRERGAAVMGAEPSESRNVVIAMCSAFMFLFIIVGVIVAMDRRQKQQQLVAQNAEELELQNLLDIPDEQPTPDPGTAGLNKGSGGGSKPKPERAAGGGGGGREEQKPASFGKVPQASLDVPQIVAPDPKPPKINNPSLPVPATVVADPALVPPDARVLPYGDYKSKSTDPSSGPGTGNGIGTGTGGGIGPGEGGGLGPGRGGNIGGGDFNAGGGGPGGGGGGGDYNKIFTGKDVTTKARLISKPEPQYTEDARKNQVTGTVVLKVVFASSGQVTNIRTVSGLPNGLTERAIAAARQIKFVPATKDGHQVSMWMQLEYNFNLY
ncbi:MAG TPA: TonB family protein [Pyrinomonadaceae bacterium]|nr:TonB family protein [Pyrinomonadaceae bacterium]